MQKFELLQEPSNTWAVFDTTRRAPAERGGKPLIGLSREEAEIALFRLNVDILRSNRKPAPRRD